MIDLRFNEEVMDDDDDGWDEDDDWLMAPVTPPRATMTVSSTYEVGGPSTATPMDNLEYRHGVLTRRIEAVSDIEVANSIAIGKIHPRVTTVEEQERLTVLEKRLPGPLLGPQIMPLKAMSEAHMREVIREQVVASMAEFVANMNRRAGGARAGGAEAGGAEAGGVGASGAGAGGAGVGGAGPTTPEITGCTYITFMKCDLQPFKGTEGAVGLCQWFEKLESVFRISDCKE
ncbi:hypothetical protein Tco_0030159, partial [Tanacetum coccineum]